MKNRLLTKYWLTFDGATRYAAGIGVTAYGLEDALGIVAENLFQSQPLPACQHRIINSLAELEPSHVLPNLGLIMFRGIWFPHFPLVIR